MRYLVFLLCLCDWLYANGQLVSASSPPYFSTINCYSKNFIDVFSLIGNAAASSQLGQPSFGVYLERRFMLAELNQYSIAAGLPTKVGAFGFQLSLFGFEAYREMEPAVGYSKKLGVIDLGIKFNYRLIKVPNYGNSSCIIPEIGSIWHITEKVHTGFQIYNPVSFFKNGMGNRTAYHYSSGLGYEVSPIVFLGLAISKEEAKNVELKTALQYRFSDMFFAAIGISSNDTHTRFSFGYRYHSLRIDATTSWNSRLGISPGFMLIYSRPDKVK